MNREKQLEKYMGEMLGQMPKQEGYRTPTGLQSETPLLEDLGISKIQSHRYQQLEKYMGEMLENMELKERRQENLVQNPKLHDETSTLDDLGISKIQSHRYQQLDFARKGE